MKIPPGKKYLRHISYDPVIFGFAGSRLKVLITRFRNMDVYALPGGFIHQDEDLETAVQRGLKERTGLDKIYLEQFHTFGDMKRSDPGIMGQFLEVNGLDPLEYEFLFDRFVTVAYYALVNYEKVDPQPDSLSDYIGWYDLEGLPGLMLDHVLIVKEALRTLRANLDHKLVGASLLPERFTMKELQEVYESILGESLSRTNFQRKMLSLGFLERHEKKYTGKAHKAPYLYTFRN